MAASACLARAASHAGLPARRCGSSRVAKSNQWAASATLQFIISPGPLARPRLCFRVPRYPPTRGALLYRVRRRASSHSGCPCASSAADVDPWTVPSATERRFRLDAWGTRLSSPASASSVVYRSASATGVRQRVPRARFGWNFTISGTRDSPSATESPCTIQRPSSPKDSP